MEPTKQENEESLFSQEERLGGRPARPVRALLYRIQKRTAYMVSQSEIALEILLTRRATRSASVEDTLPPGSTLPGDYQVSLEDLERFAPHWRYLIPESPTLRASVAYLLNETYKLADMKIPNIRDALALDSSEVARAYSDLFDMPLSSILPMAVVTSVMRIPTPEERVTRGWHSSVGAAANFNWLQVKRGEVIFQQGDPSDSLYVVITGRVRIVLTDHDGHESAVADLGRGQIVGEMGVLTNEARTGTAYAVRDSELVVLPKAEFFQAIEQQPKMLMDITRTVIGRLRHQLQNRYRQELVNLTLLPLGVEVAAGDFARRLGAALSIYGSVLHLSSSNLDQYFGEGALEALDSDAGRERMIDKLDEQETSFRFLIYEGDVQDTTWTQLCLRQADRILLLGAAPDTGPHFLDKMPESAGRDLLILHKNRHHPPTDTRAWLNRWKASRYYHVALDSDVDIQRVARRLTGRGIALALGAGGAKSLGHVGVLRALEEEAIPIDVIGGTSAGSVVGGLVAMGFSSEEIYPKIVELFTSPRDRTLPMISWWQGKKFTQRLRALFEETRIEDLWLEYFCITANLSRACMMVHREGPLWRYVRASCSAPGLFPPVVDKGELLVDGGILNMVPTDVAAQICESNLVIGVELTSGTGQPEGYDFKPDQSGWGVIANRLNPFARQRVRAPGIIEILTQTSMIPINEQRAHNQQHARLYMRLPLQEFSVFELHNPEKAVQIGYDVARQQLEVWRSQGYQV